MDGDIRITKTDEIQTGGVQQTLAHFFVLILVATSEPITARKHTILPVKILLYGHKESTALLVTVVTALVVFSLVIESGMMKIEQCIQHPVPDGYYNRNTKTEYCCRSNGSPYTEVILPPTKPFVLYRYQGVCQKVKGMTARQLYIHFDDEDRQNKNKCGGNRPDGSCSRNHDIYSCYYTPR